MDITTKTRYPTVSVVIPTCNRADFLIEAIQSALNQTIEILEVIVVDDGSDLDLRPILAPFGDKVRYEYLGQKGGANVARNLGIDLARGDLIAFLDDDDLFLPDKIETQIAAMGDRFEGCLCPSCKLGSEPASPGPKHRMNEARLRVSSPCGTTGLVVRRDVVKAVRFDPSIPRGQDWDLFVRLVQRQELAYVATPLYLRRVGHGDRITVAASRQTPEELYATAAAVHKHREWLGEAAYRRRLARLLLSFIGSRKGKLRYLTFALKHAGPKATAQEIIRKFR